MYLAHFIDVCYCFLFVALPPSPPNTSSEGSVSDHDDEYRLQQAHVNLALSARQSRNLYSPVSPYSLTSLKTTSASETAISPNSHAGVYTYGAYTQNHILATTPTSITKQTDNHHVVLSPHLTTGIQTTLPIIKGT